MLIKFDIEKFYWINIITKDRWCKNKSNANIIQINYVITNKYISFMIFIYYIYCHQSYFLNYILSFFFSFLFFSLLLLISNQDINQQIQTVKNISVSILSIFTFSLDFCGTVGMCGPLAANCSGILDGIRAFKNMVAQSLFILE